MAAGYISAGNISPVRACRPPPAGGLVQLVPMCILWYLFLL